MVTLSQAQIVGIVSLALILSGVVAVEFLEKSYYCASEDNVKECLRVTSSGITCYYLTADDITRGDRCTGGTWELLEGFVSRPKPDPIPSGPSFTTSDDCLVDGKYCYCNPRGLIKNKALC